MTAVAERYVQALNQGDLDAVMALFAADACVEDPVGSEPRRGTEAIRGFFQRVTSTPMTVVHDGEPRAVANEVAFGLKLSFTRDGKHTTLSVIDHFRFNADGDIVAMRAFFGPQNIHVA
ncbi:steroid delta-isomerase [Comamonas serinivorans]|uniref:Steroid delta-isomerase n=2 Tax=Comamonas serinivorans TaxID=1082851 RepID=A0A1Y0EU44_9BURK|nr:steroid delta-isomerase [Comamonas serinivorans]